jgi:hypothetical protein
VGIVFESLSDQIISMIAGPRRGDMEGLLTEARRFTDLDVPKAPAARAPTAEDQVLLSRAAQTPPAPIPVKPTEPAEAGYRVKDFLRRLRESRRKTPPRAAVRSGDPPEDGPDNPPSGHRFDRWA